MAVSLEKMRDALMPGLHLMSHAIEPIFAHDISNKYPHLLALYNAGNFRFVGDLTSIPASLAANGVIYQTSLVPAGREYPQGWGRGPGGAAAEPPPEPDGKVETYRYEDNDNMKALKAEIQAFIEERVYAKS